MYYVVGSAVIIIEHLQLFIDPVLSTRSTVAQSQTQPSRNMQAKIQQERRNVATFGMSAGDKA